MEWDEKEKAFRLETAGDTKEIFVRPGHFGRGGIKKGIGLHRGRGGAGFVLSPESLGDLFLWAKTERLGLEQKEE